MVDTREQLPASDVSSKELLKLGRRVERLSSQRRKLLVKVEELEGSIREAKRLFRQLADALMVQAELPEDQRRGEDVP